MSTITGNAEFNNSENNGNVEGVAVFNGTAENNGVVENGIFNDNSSNNGEIVEFGVFADSAQNNGEVGTLVTEPPSIINHPISLCTTGGGNAVFTADASGYLVNYRWVVDGVEREENEGLGAAYSGNNATLNLSVFMGNIYKSNVKCRFYNPIGSVETDVAVLNAGVTAVIKDPHVAVGPGQETYNEYSTLQVPVEGVSYADKVYVQFQVSYDGIIYNNYGNILELNTTSYPSPGSTVSNFSGLLDSGVTLVNPNIMRARVRVYDCFGEGNTTLWWWTYFNNVSIDPTITVQPISGEAYAGEYVTFTVEADDNAPGEDSLSYQWKFGQTPIQGANSNTLNVQIPFGASNGSSMGAEYTCVVYSVHSSYPAITNPVTATSLGERPPPPPPEE